MSVSVKFNHGSFDASLAAFEQDVSDAVRPAAQAGAQVLYGEVKKNVEALGRKTGKLASAIYQAFSKDNSEEGVKATYHVSWNAKKAPHGHLIEYGYMQVYQVVVDKDGNFVTLKNRKLKTPKQIPAHPFVRPAQAKIAAALDAAEREFYRHLNEGSGASK